MSNSRENFIRLAEKRTNKVIKDIDLLSNLSNKTNYSFTEQDVRKIFSAVALRLKESEAQFQASLKKTAKEKFKL